jgi:hypothetical protein
MTQMKHKKKIFTLSILILISLAVGIVAYATTTAGTSDDPLATKSYIDTAIDNVKKYVDGKTPSSTDGGYVVFSLSSGKTMIANKGSQIILRSGTATIISSKSGGIADTTAGVDLPNGANMPKNHLLIVPGSDERGFKTTGDVWVMISGGYTLK